MAQGNGRIDAYGPPARDEAGKDRNQNQGYGRAGHRDRAGSYGEIPTSWDRKILFTAREAASPKVITE